MQADSYQAVPLDVPELYDLEPLLLNLPSQSGLGELPALFNHDHQQLQHHTVKVGRPAQPRPYQELHFLRVRQGPRQDCDTQQLSSASCCCCG